MRRAIIFVLGVVLFGLAAWTAASARPATEKPDGASLYKQRCAMCHGPGGKGFPALKSPDMTDPKWQASVKDKEIFDVIKNGKKGTAMPGFGNKLSDEEIQALTAHIRSLNSKKKK